MSNKPNDMTQKSKSNTDAQSSSERKELTEQATGKETAREAVTRLLSTDPRCREVKNSGQGFVIVGARPLLHSNSAVSAR